MKEGVGVNGSQSFRTGKYYTEWKTDDVLVRTMFSEPTLSIVYGIPELSLEQANALFHKDVVISIAVVDNIPFILFRLSDARWKRVPFEPHRYPKSLFSTSFDPGETILVAFLLVDTKTGKLIKIWKWCVSRTFANGLYKECRKIQALPWIGQEAHTEVLNRIYEQYPTGDAMLKTAKLEYTSGIINLQD